MYYTYLYDYQNILQTWRNILIRCQWKKAAELCSDQVICKDDLCPRGKVLKITWIFLHVVDPLWMFASVTMNPKKTHHTKFFI